MSISKKIKIIRSDLKLSKFAFSKGTAISYRSICLYEQGARVPDSSSCLRIINYCKSKGLSYVNFEWLFE